MIEELSRCFTKLRVDIMNQYDHGTSNYYLLKSWHRLLETDKYDLDNGPRYNGFYRAKLNYRDLYELIRKVSPDLTKAYELKEMYRDFNKKATSDNCSKWYDQVIDAFIEADMPCYRKFIAMIQEWHQEILNSFQRPYNDRKESNAAENINGSLREAITVSKGLSNFERFRARSIYSLNKHLTYTITENLKSKKRKSKERGQYTKSSIDKKITDTDDSEQLKD